MNTLAEIALLTLMAAASALSVCVLSFPDRYQKYWVAYVPLVPLFLFCAVIALEWLQDIAPSPLPDHSGWECLRCIVFASLVPAGWMFYRLRTMASTHPVLIGGVALLGAISISCLALRLSEKTDSVVHLLQWHYIPALAVSALGLAAGKIFLKW